MQDGCLTFAGFLMKDIFIWWDKAFPGCRVNALTEKNVYVSLCILVLLFTSLLLCCIVKIFIKLLQGHSNFVSKVFICSQSLKDQTFCDAHPGNSHLAIVMPGVRIPEREERKPPRQCNSQKKGKFIADSSQGSCRIQRSGAGSESPKPKLLHKFIGWA